MKKTNIVITTLLVMVATAVAVVSCKKEKLDQNKNDSEQTVQNADNMDEYLMAFKKKLLSAEKGGETISLEQAERDLGNLLNFDFGDANYATNEFHQDTLCAKLTKTANGQVDLSQLAATYNVLFPQIRDAYNNVCLQNKSVYFIACSLSDDAKTDDESDVEIILMTRGFNEDNNTEGNRDGWKPDRNSSSCDGAIIGRGAPNVLDDLLNNELGMYGYDCDEGQGRIYMSEVEYSIKSAYCSDMVDSNSPCGYKLYVSWEPDQNNVCISNSEIMYYFQQARTLWRVYDNFTPSIPSNHVPVIYCVYYRAHGYNFINGHIVPVLPFFWDLQVGHARIHCSPVPPEV